MVLYRLLKGVCLGLEKRVCCAAKNCMATQLEGSPKKRSKWRIFWMVFLGFALFGLVLRIAEGPKKEPTAAERAEADSLARLNKIGEDAKYAYIKADRAIKNSLKDPDSYERIEERAGYVGTDGIYVSCLVTYRAKNSFGGYNVEKALVSFDDKMEPISVKSIE